MDTTFASGLAVSPSGTRQDDGNADQMPGDAPTTDVGEGFYNFRLFTVAAMRTLPPPGWLIRDVLPSRGISVVYGPHGHGKSFLTLDWALSVGAGRAWAGHEVSQGDVVYVAAEGASGYAARTDAWLAANELPEPPVYFLTHPVQLVNGDREATDLERLLEVVREEGLKPKLFILDTLSRCLAGADENSTKALSTMVGQVERWSNALHASFVLVHHTRKNDDEIRGSSVLGGAATMMAKVKHYAREKTVKLSCTKMKDAPRFPTFELGMQEVLDSLVLTTTIVSGPDASVDGDYSERLNESDTFVLSQLPEVGATQAVWRRLATDAFQSRDGTAKRSTVYRAIRRLRERGYVFLDADKKTYRRVHAEEDSEVTNVPT